MNFSRPRNLRQGLAIGALASAVCLGLNHLLGRLISRPQAKVSILRCSDGFFGGVKTDKRHPVWWWQSRQLSEYFKVLPAASTAYQEALAVAKEHGAKSVVFSDDSVIGEDYSVPEQVNVNIVLEEAGPEGGIIAHLVSSDHDNSDDWYFDYRLNGGQIYPDEEVALAAAEQLVADYDYTVVDIINHLHLNPD